MCSNCCQNQWKHWLTHTQGTSSWVQSSQYNALTLITPQMATLQERVGNDAKFGHVHGDWTHTDFWCLPAACRNSLHWCWTQNLQHNEAFVSEDTKLLYSCCSLHPSCGVHLFNSIVHLHSLLRDRTRPVKHNFGWSNPVDYLYCYKWIKKSSSAPLYTIWFAFYIYINNYMYTLFLNNWSLSVICWITRK